VLRADRQLEEFMSSHPAARDVNREGLHAFMDRLNRTLGHDLHGSLGTIVNYATVLEEDAPADADHVRFMSQRIRRHAMRTAEMLQRMLDATLLASSRPAPSRFDAVALLEPIAVEMGEAMRIVVVSGLEEGDAVEFDPAIVGFLWRVFLDFVRLVSPGLAHEVRVARSRRDGQALFTLRMGHSDPNAAAVGLDAFLARDPNDSAPSHGFELTLCRELVAVRGGLLEFFGRAGVDVAVRLRFPQAVAA
jgi:light-regulated signal transduction histidine kinase (bacteriophytochrome)